MEREAFLRRVREAAEAGARYRVAVEPVPEAAGYVGAKGELCQALADEVAFVGGQPQLVHSWAEAHETVAQWLEHYEARSVLCWQHPVLERLGLSELVAQRGITAHDYSQLSQLSGEERKEIVLAADVGISSADWAIAETGTLAVCARPGQERLSSLIAPVHIAVIARDQIVPDLFDFFARLAIRDGAALPSNVALISGPSKTGDIELELTTGVHGPGQWHVIIVAADR